MQRSMSRDRDRKRNEMLNEKRNERLAISVRSVRSKRSKLEESESDSDKEEEEEEAPTIIDSNESLKRYIRKNFVNKVGSLGITSIDQLTTKLITSIEKLENVSLM